MKWSNGFLAAISGAALMAVIGSGAPASAVPPDQDPHCTKVIYAPGDQGDPGPAYDPIPGTGGHGDFGYNDAGPLGPGAWGHPPPPQMGPPPAILNGVPGVEVRDDDGHSYYKCDTA